MNVREIGFLGIMYVLECVKCLVGYSVFFGKRPKKIYGMAVGGVLFILLFFSGRLGENALYVLMYVIVYVSMLPSVKGGVVERVGKVLLVLYIITCLDQVNEILLKLGFRNLNSYTINLLESIASFVGLCIIFLLVKKHIFCFRKMSDLIQKSIYTLIAFLLFFILLTIGILPFVMGFIQNEGFKIFLGIFSVLAFFSVGLLIFFIIYVKSTNEELRKTVDIKIKIEEMQKKYYNAKLEKEESTRRYRHDMEGMMQGLMALAMQGDINSIQEYITNLQKDLRNIKKGIYETGIEILDTILICNAQPLDDVDICVTGKCKLELEVDTVDFSIIFSNLLKNAAEAVENQKSGDKYIHVKIDQGKEYIRFSIKNSTDKHLELNADGKIETSKCDKKNHGIGLLSTAERVERNGGEFDIRLEENAFETILTLRCGGGKITI